MLGKREGVLAMMSVYRRIKINSKVSAPLRSVLLLGLLTCLLTGCGLLRPGDDGNVPAKAQHVMQSAYSQIGSKYRLGGASPQKGFDCSGLIYWAYSRNGVKVPRITTDQARAGQSVSKYSAHAGDIVVFRTGQSPRGLHTGIYAGDNSFIHSPGRGKRVRMDKLDNSYWKDKLVSVRRVIR